MTIERGKLLGSYQGSWHFVAATAAFPLLALLVGSVQTLGRGAIGAFLGLLGLAVLAWVGIGLWTLARRATRVSVYEQAVVWKRPMRAERVIAMKDIRQVKREGGESVRAVLLYLADQSYVALEGFSELREIASLVQRGLEGPQASSGWTPRIVGPEPLVTWIRWASWGIDGGAIWIDNTPESCWVMLRESWGIHDRAQLMETQKNLLSRSPNAWDDLRAMRVLLSGARVGLVSEPELWSAIVPICQRVQSRYPSFEAVWLDYLAGVRVWQKLPADGSLDQTSPSTRQVGGWIEKGRLRAPAVPFDLALSASPAPGGSSPASGWSPPGGSAPGSSPPVAGGWSPPGTSR